MNSILVLDLFHTRHGEIAIFDFPDGGYPKLGMRLKKENGSYWKITGVSMGKLASMTNAYKHLEPDRFIFIARSKQKTPSIN